MTRRVAGRSPEPEKEPVVPEPPLTSVSSARRALLTELKRCGASTAAELSSRLGVTVPAVRQQLRRLDEDGLVTHRRVLERRGRPAHLYELAPASEELFPKRYGDLTTELLGYLGGPRDERVDRLFEKRRRRRLADARPRLEGKTLDEQVAELARILDEDGYMAGFERLGENHWRIIEHNCAILAVAKHYRQACASEIAFIRDVLPTAKVERVSHMMDGAHVCAYEVAPADSERRTVGTIAEKPVVERDNVIRPVAYRSG
jgi:DeoR family transcriptional regulator, suf operon transcriptional repressor